MTQAPVPTLVLCGDRWHPAAVPQQGLAPLEDLGFAFDWIEAAHDWSVERMAAYPLVILAKSDNLSSTDHASWMTPAVEAAFAEYVRAGHGLLAIHAGTAGYAGKPVLPGLLGGVFTQHPEQCLVTLEPETGHPLTADSAAFAVQDEHYFMAMHDPQADIFLTSRSEYGSQPAGWRRTEGSGRVVILTPGHTLEVWRHPTYQRLLLNSLRWCGKISL